MKEEPMTAQETISTLNKLPGIGDIIEVTKSITTGTKLIRRGVKASFEQKTFRGVIDRPEPLIPMAMHYDTLINFSYYSHFDFDGGTRDNPALVTKHLHGYIPHDEDFKVVGNITRNPELLLDHFIGDVV